MTDEANSRVPLPSTPPRGPLGRLTHSASSPSIDRQRDARMREIHEYLQAGRKLTDDQIAWLVQDSPTDQRGLQFPTHNPRHAEALWNGLSEWAQETIEWYFDRSRALTTDWRERKKALLALVQEASDVEMNSGFGRHMRAAQERLSDPKASDERKAAARAFLARGFVAEKHDDCLRLGFDRAMIYAVRRCLPERPRKMAQLHAPKEKARRHTMLPDALLVDGSAEQVSIESVRRPPPTVDPEIEDLVESLSGQDSLRTVIATARSRGLLKPSQLRALEQALQGLPSGNKGKPGYDRRRFSEAVAVLRKIAPIEQLWTCR